EDDQQHRTGRPRTALAVLAHLDDAGVAEHRRVEPGRLLSLVVEPQARADRRHDPPPSSVRDASTLPGHLGPRPGNDGHHHRRREPHRIVAGRKGRVHSTVDTPAPHPTLSYRRMATGAATNGADVDLAPLVGGGGV